MNGLRWNLEIFRYNTEVSIAICCIFDKIFRVWINIKGLYSPVKYRGIWMVKYGGSAMKYVRSSIKYGGSDMKYGWSPMKFGNIGISITIWFDVSSINYLGSLMKYEGSPLSSKILRVYAGELRRVSDVIWRVSDVIWRVSEVILRVSDVIRRSPM